jgi:hypothetical protein
VSNIISSSSVDQALLQMRDVTGRQIVISQPLLTSASSPTAASGAPPLGGGVG